MANSRPSFSLSSLLGWAASLLCLVVFSTHTYAGSGTNTKLVLVGGGDKPAQALQQFVSWAGGSQGRLLVISWASEIPANEILQDYQATFGALGVTQVEIAPALAQFPAATPQFLQQLSQATSVFFTGGDQNRIATLLDQIPQIRQELKATYRRGIVFGGTSAGTAIMSKTMLTGDGDLTVIRPGAAPVREGLGLLDQVVVDQHFILRQRSNRLLSVMMTAQEKVGIGIDESTSLIVEGDCFGTVVGPSQVLFFHKKTSSLFDLKILLPGESIDWCGMTAR